MADSILRSQVLDPSPSKRTALGSDVAVLNLRPVDESRMLGRSHLRVKAQSSIQEQLDRMSMERTKVLPLDPSLSVLNRRNTVEHSLQGTTSKVLIMNSAKPRHSKVSLRGSSNDKIFIGRNSPMSIDSATERHRDRRSNDKEMRQNATLETILKRNNSISVVKKHAIPHG